MVRPGSQGLIPGCMVWPKKKKKKAVDMNENIYPTQLGVPIRACVELQFHMCILYFQAKETNSKKKEFEETAKKVRCAIEQLVALE